MNARKFFKYKAIGTIVVLAVVFTAAFLLQKHAPDPLPDSVPRQVTLSGTYVCLPHKDTSGPQTLECAFGLLAENGLYYALSFDLASQTGPNLSFGEHITLSGTLVPIEQISTDHWQRYNIAGILSITDPSKKP